MCAVYLHWVNDIVVIKKDPSIEENKCGRSVFFESGEWRTFSGPVGTGSIQFAPVVVAQLCMQSYCHL